MMDEACPADGDGFIVLTDAPAFLGELRKSNRRRVRLDPASKSFKTRTIAAHDEQFTAKR